MKPARDRESVLARYATSPMNCLALPETRFDLATQSNNQSIPSCAAAPSVPRPMSYRPVHRLWRPSVVGVWFFSALPLRAPAADTIENVQRAATEWSKLRVETVRLETEWKWQRDSLQASLDALKERIKTLEQNRDELAASIAADETKSGNLAQTTAASREAMATIEQRLQKITAQLVAIRPLLPPRLSLGLELPFRSIQDAKPGPAERMQHVMTIINRCALFNKSVTCGEEALNLDGGPSPRLLGVVYWGLSHAYALDRNGNKAYFGHPGKTGWIWEPEPEIAEAVAHLLAINAEKADPAFVEVPAQIKASPAP